MGSTCRHTLWVYGGLGPGQVAFASGRYFVNLPGDHSSRGNDLRLGVGFPLGFRMASSHSGHKRTYGPRECLPLKKLGEKNKSPTNCKFCFPQKRRKSYSFKIPVTNGPTKSNNFRSQL